MDAEHEKQSIHQRLDWLEKQNRRLRFGLFATIGCVLLSVSVGFADPSVQESIVARDFKLVDGRGRVNARLWINSKGPVLGFWDSANVYRAHLSLRDDVPSLIFGDPAKRSGKLVAQAGFEKTEISLYDKKNELLWQAPEAAAK